LTMPRLDSTSACWSNGFVTRADNFSRPPMISRIRPSYSFDEVRAALRPPADAVATFEHALAAHLGVRHAVAFTWGRVAVHTVLRALGLSGEVVQPAYTCLAVAHATVMAGLRPVFVDAQADSPNQDPDAMVERVGPQTAAVLPTCSLGITFDARQLCERIRERNPKALIVLDLCMCLDERWNGLRLAGEGDAAVVAFGSEKPITTLGGGALVTNRDDIAEVVRSYRDQAFRRPTRAAIRRRWLYFLGSWIAYSRCGTAVGDAVRTTWRGYVFGAPHLRGEIRLPFDATEHMPAMAAAIGCAQLRRAGALQRRRAAICTAYDHGLRDVPGLQLLDLAPPVSYGFFYCARVAHPEVRDAVVACLHRRGIGAGTVWNYVVPGLDCYRERGYSVTEFPNATRWSNTVINLPNYPAMTAEDVDTTIRAVAAAISCRP
jgi:perosamine synthetase